ncbi:hypothetical protein GCM10009665_37410 [Kitasatospora nipponensis]|uniref:CHRD domain-containing protein n=1 Tax=Kitasatospora nipponensis TaxID=258049 RepID=A0ABN1WH66_9ACTN
MNKLLIPFAVAAAVLPLGAGVASADATPHAATEHDQSTMVSFARLSPVVNNRVTGLGNATVQLTGDNAQITIHVRGLLNDAPHAMHIHLRGSGECPEADDSTLLNGHLATSTADGLNDYGPIGTSLTTHGDTSPASALAIDRFPNAGTYTYVRTIQVTDDVARAIRSDNAVIVVHGIDYNSNGKYDNVLGSSELDPKLPQEATAPALCGPLS